MLLWTIADEPAVPSKEKTTEMGETVLDRKVHIEKENSARHPCGRQLPTGQSVTTLNVILLRLTAPLCSAKEEMR